MSDLYLPPVDRLLKLGAEPARRRSWPDYRNLGLEDRHVPALVRMATDPALFGVPERDPRVWAPVHAWRALGQLRAPAAAEPLLALLRREAKNDWVYAEVPAVLGMIGPAALPGATLLLFDEEADEELRIAAADVVAGVGEEYPERRDEAAAVLTTQMQDWARQSRELNAFLVTDLVALGEVKVAPLLEAAFQAGAVDLSLGGDWEDAQIALGLLQERITPPLHDLDQQRRAGSRTSAADAEARARTRRKAEKQARKRNRKKK